MKDWIQKRMLKWAMWTLIKCNQKNLDSQQLLQTKFRMTLNGTPYDGIIVVANGNFVKIHEAQTVEVNPDGTIVGEAKVQLH